MAVRHVLLAAATLLLACPPVMVEREGHRVFNPAYLFALEGRSRDRWQRPEEVLRVLALPPDAVVADIGAGGGYFTERLARALPEGRVFAVDVQDEMIARLRERVQDEELHNVVVVRGRFDDSGLPPGCCDLVLLSSVYKELERRVAYMRGVRELLRPGGRVAILEFRPGAPGAGPPPEMRLAPERIVAELEAAGFVLLESHDVVPTQSFLVFGAGRPTPPAR